MRPDHIWPDRFHRLFPHPFLSLILAASWLMLMHSVEAAHLLLALLVAIIFPKLTQHFIQPAEPVHWPTAIQLFVVVLWDILVANVRVARQVLGPLHQLHPKWVRVPLDTVHPKVNTLLALIITTTPGTVSAGLEEGQNNILVHALSSDDPNAVIEEIKQRYEQPLIKIFNAQINDLPNPPSSSALKNHSINPSSVDPNSVDNGSVKAVNAAKRMEETPHDD
ncbi:MAG: Na+/H+ antiporter subunit E [Moraxellaceae bacterium]|nr:MAG: Na+/H+ antiporter subunit E [Moraxellaceae bacterium]